ncbi:hypothetical protein O6H91_19G063800 [Diphasiastrum complanatum]|uniref:Uncharacterized protein n=1 Tax=Diphasiastrum complanatum TaxID=34168 RepID=A0ACC2AVZ1_DIPCM|nr:hypothetical protein O6H91_19G063800 [Diphasiastrum complanatum]
MVASVGSAASYDRFRSGSFDARQPQPVLFRRRDNGCSQCYCCFASLLVGVLVAVAVLLLLIFLVFKPQQPSFDLRDVTVSSFEVDQPLTGSSSYTVLLSMDCTLVLAASNPNKVSIKYSPVHLNVLYHGHQIGIASAPAFEQPAHSNTAVQASLTVQKLSILQGDAMELLKDVVNDNVPLIITGTVRARISVLGVDSPRVQVRTSSNEQTISVLISKLVLLSAPSLLL